jgi:hypothetical protein
MKIPDESERVASLAREAFAGIDAERPGAFWRLQEFSYSVAGAAQREFESNGGDTGKAISKAIEVYQEERRCIIEFRRRKGLPVTDS